MPNNPTGYDPNTLTLRQGVFNSDDDDFELWEVKFMAHLRLNKLHSVLNQTRPTDDTQAAAYDENNAKIFSMLVLSLDGKAALEILREHYIGTSKPCVISLYCELTTLKMAADEDVVAYLLRAETYATRLKAAKENVSDSLLIAMIIKGLPTRYRTFTAMVSQMKSDDLDYAHFKTSLRTFDENEKAR